ncbi:MAG TPA: hypothetical protein VJN50_08375 [Actinomycetota bacterium]|nr:hypothetical protein [Actinomycetota bacterium]
MQERSAGPSAAAVLAVAGGLMIVLGSLSAWADASVPGFTPVPWKGSQSVAGKLVLLAGVVVAGVGVASLSRLPVGRPLAAVALAGGMAAGVLAILVALTLDGRVADDVVAFYMRQLAMPGAAAQSLVDGAIGTGQFRVTPAVGLLAAIAGSFIAIVAGMLARMWAVRAAALGWSRSPDEPRAEG